MNSFTDKERLLVIYGFLSMLRVEHPGLKSKIDLLIRAVNLEKEFGQKDLPRLRPKPRDKK